MFMHTCLFTYMHMHINIYTYTQIVMTWQVRERWTQSDWITHGGSSALWRCSLPWSLSCYPFHIQQGPHRCMDLIPHLSPDTSSKSQFKAQQACFIHVYKTVLLHLFYHPQPSKIPFILPHIAEVPRHMTIGKTYRNLIFILNFYSIMAQALSNSHPLLYVMFVHICTASQTVAVCHSDAEACFTLYYIQYKEAKN